MAIHNSGALRARIRRRKAKKDVHMILNTVISRLHMLRTRIRRCRAGIKKDLRFKDYRLQIQP